MKKFQFSVLAMMIMAFVSVGFASCGSDDEEEGSVGNSALVGIWTRQYDNRGVIGIKLTADGKVYYNEWDISDDIEEELKFKNVVSPARATVTATTIRITHPQVPDSLLSTKIH